MGSPLVLAARLLDLASPHTVTLGRRAPPWYKHAATLSEGDRLAGATRGQVGGRRPVAVSCGIAVRVTAVTAYDAFYVALAESLAMPLLTSDHQFARSPAHVAVIQTWS